MTDSDHWFTEICEECGSAFSLEIQEKLHEEQSEFQRIEVYATKTFGNLVAVDDLSLTVPKGRVCGFIGPNGSGKTTTLRMIMNVFYPDSGTIAAHPS